MQKRYFFRVALQLNHFSQVNAVVENAIRLKLREGNAKTIARVLEGEKNSGQQLIKVKILHDSFCIKCTYKAENEQNSFFLNGKLS